MSVQLSKNQKQKLWRQANPEKLRQYKRRNYYKNREVVQAERKRYYIRHKDSILAKTKQYRQDNKLVVLLNDARSRAKKLGLDFNIEQNDLFIPEKCPILGTPIVSPSIDRIDNSKGYIKGNVKVISKLANTMKNSATKEELLAFSNNIKNYLETP